MSRKAQLLRSSYRHQPTRSVPRRLILSLKRKMYELPEFLLRECGIGGRLGQ